MVIVYLYLCWIAKKLIIFHHDKVEYFQGSYEDFLLKIGWDEDIPSEMPTKNNNRPSRQEMKRMRSELIIDRGRELNPLKKKMEVLEKEIIKLEEEQGEIEKSLIDLASTSDSKKIQEKSQRLGVIKKRIDEAFEELSSVTNNHDEIYNNFEDKLKDLEVFNKNIL